ncbi:UNKNOWN [Stylonychia lemnae]|uniref:Uncharacterized protein n=1 Tax=Stylonychia lemnae TaxID=5949 RepID=A0A078ATE1_STYLE|nr:UNKNOWN [Stylonychia lemnae]|eukprot:CDW85276.1 UNKNOWN [Stylonychia lemnae]
MVGISHDLNVLGNLNGHDNNNNNTSSNITSQSNINKSFRSGAIHKFPVNNNFFSPNYAGQDDNYLRQLLTPSVNGYNYTSEQTCLQSPDDQFQMNFMMPPSGQTGNFNNNFMIGNPNQSQVGPNSFTSGPGLNNINIINQANSINNNINLNNSFLSGGSGNGGEGFVQKSFQYMASKKAASMLKQYSSNIQNQVSKSNERPLGKKSSQSQIHVNKSFANQIGSVGKIEPPQVPAAPRSKSQFTNALNSNSNLNNNHQVSQNKLKSYLHVIQSSTKLLTKNSSPSNSKDRTKPINQSTKHYSNTNKILEGLVSNFKKAAQSKIANQQANGRREKDVIVRKNSSKSFLNKKESTGSKILNMTDVDIKIDFDQYNKLNITQSSQDSKSKTRQELNSTQVNWKMNLIPGQQTKISDQAGQKKGINIQPRLPGYISKVQNIIRKNKVNFNQQQQQHLNLNQTTNSNIANNDYRNFNNYLNSNERSPSIQNIGADTFNVNDIQNSMIQPSYQVIQHETNSTSNTENKRFQINFEDQQSFKPRLNNETPQLRINLPSYTRRTNKNQSDSSNLPSQYAHQSTMGNSVAKKTLNMTHNINESTLFEMNHTLNLNRNGQYGGRHKKNILSNNTNASARNNYMMNITQLLKDNMLEEEGVEDVHFYQVAFINHKQKILRKMEHAAMLEQMKKELYEKGKIDQDRDLKKSKLRNKPMKNLQDISDQLIKQEVKTIESVDELEIL